MGTVGRRSIAAVVSLLLVLTWAQFAAADAAQVPQSVWLEAEQPASTNVKPNLAGWGHKEFLSGGAWLSYALDEAAVAKSVPADGILISYNFTAPADGQYTVWNRVGWDSIRSPFAWRIDGGAWTEIPHAAPTVDLMELDYFVELSWLNMGQTTLTKGNHSLDIRIPVPRDAAGHAQGIHYASDAFCLVQGDWTPFSHFKPGEDSQSPQDIAAAKNVFVLPEATGPGARSRVPLKGAWEFARASEDFTGKVPEPMKLDDLGPDPHWVAIDVPGNKNARPDLLMTHRFFYRTQVNIPASAAGRSFFITFPSNNLNTTVFCNGVYCGFNKNPLAPFSIDLTAAIKPGQVNTIEVGMRDFWYAYEFDHKDPNWVNHFRMPTLLLNAGWQRLIYPVSGHSESGILQTPVLASSGPAYVSDVFVKTSVARHEIAPDVTLENPSSRQIDGQIDCQVLDCKTGQVVKTLSPKPFTAAPGSEQVVNLTEGWADPQLWWPDDPHLYTMRTTVVIGGQPVDTYDQRFGFREWTIDGIHFKLNGVIFHGWNEGHGASSPQAWLAFERKTHQNTVRFFGDSWMGMNAEQTLDFMDENGMVVRRSERMDGEGMNYILNKDIIPNWRDQLLQQMRSERNHPSLMIYSIENEILYINVINVGACDWWEPLEWTVAQAAMQFDPTHPVMTDGGGAMKAQCMPVHGTHYMCANNDIVPITEYPARAYDENVTGGGRGRWVWDMKEPRYVGEDWFLAGNHPELSAIGGEAALGGKTSLLPATGKIITICQQGYRFADFGVVAWSIFDTDTDGSEFNSMSPRAVFCRQWDWSFASGATVPRTMGIFNDTRFDDPITFTWTLTVGGKQVATDSSTHSINAGTRDIFDIKLPMPTVTTREEGQLVLSLSVKGQQVFTDTKDISVLPPVASIAPTDLLVYDPAGTAITFLKQNHVHFTELPDLKTLPDGKVLLIGKDALSNEDSLSTRFAVWAEPGRSVIVLEQANPLKYQALPAQVEPAKNEGRVAFLEDTNSPVAFRLAQKDFFTWSPDEILYRNAYHKPTQGARSLIECDDLLQYSALVDVPVGKGQMLLSQLVLEEKLADNAVAQQMLANLLNDAATYTLKTFPATLTTPAGSQFGVAAAAIGLQYAAVDDPLAAIADPGEKIALITASPENLATLAANQAKVDAFTNAGGWIIFNDLTPAGIADYDKIVGVDHLIRPFGGTPSLTNKGPRTIEHITFAQPRNPLTAGIPLGDIVQYSSTPIFGYQSGNFVTNDEFSYIVDYDDIAPFAKSPFPHYGNITNGFTNADGWPFIINASLNKDGSPYNIPITLPRPESIREFTWIGNKNYFEVTKVNLLFDGKTDGMGTFDVHSDSTPFTFQIDPPRKVSTVTLQLAAWTPAENRSNFGIDNIYLKVVRTPDFYAKVKPMLNIGGLMEYPRGKGGIVLCNLLFKATEEVPVNMQKKRAVLAAILRNLNAPFSTKTVIVGSHLDYTPIDISKQANQFRNEQGWFGDKRFTFANLPTGDQNFGGVQYHIYDFPTSPVPNCIMLAGRNVPNNLAAEVDGIPIHRKADALFFLQTARIDTKPTAKEIQAGRQLELFKYVVHYADGQSVEVPVVQGRDVENYRIANPQSLPGAALAWSAPYERTGTSAAAWTQQWNNPRPDAEIAAIDVAFGPDKRAVPAVLAITAATAETQ